MPAVAQKTAPPSSEQAHVAIEVLARLCAAYTARRLQLAESVGLTEQQWQVLEEINTEHFMPSLFARQRSSSAAAVSKIIRQIVDKRLVSVSVSKRDARQREYVLTAKGRRVIAHLRAARQDAIERVWMTLGAEELSVFAELGTELAVRLEEYAAEATERK